ncbi:helix-turn-helix domain-containing protein [Shewanella colwelliana]|uniref:helix-turn-helix domain-containing protein n=1 Tax=Shewanella colwelliana TaxID=23 RepID=UPI0022AE6268|nr:helix-turn-helix transcriptional regulator [Shewanella colwelliana]MCZ4337662.1 helix-turn-helix transcriptional regulator [Shewanella colwelliana]
MARYLALEKAIYQLKFGNDKYNPLAGRMRYARKLKGFTQSELGIRGGLHVDDAGTRINQYENGRHKPSFITLKHISAALEVPIEYFYVESERSAELVCFIDKMSESEKIALTERLKSTQHRNSEGKA